MLSVLLLPCLQLKQKQLDQASFLFHLITLIFESVLVREEWINSPSYKSKLNLLGVLYLAL